MTIMKQVDIDRLREAVEAARRAAEATALDSCDLDDLDDIVAPVRRELDRPRPNALTLNTYLNSLIRSLRTQPGAQDAIRQLREAMSAPGLTPETD